MKTSVTSALWLQQLLCDFAIDDWTCVYFLPPKELKSLPETIAAWQFAVDLIYRCAKADLITTANYGFTTEISLLFDALRARSPFDGEKGGFLWNGTFLRRTEKLVSIISYFFPEPNDTAINTAFFDELSALFDEASVPWSNQPLLPVSPP